MKRNDTGRRVSGGIILSLVASHSDSLVVYCAHDSVYSQRILDDFTQQTGIMVQMRFDTAKSIARSPVVSRVSRLQSMGIHSHFRGRTSAIVATACCSSGPIPSPNSSVIRIVLMGRSFKKVDNNGELISSASFLTCLAKEAVRQLFSWAIFLCSPLPPLKHIGQTSRLWGDKASVSTITCVPPRQRSGLSSYSVDLTSTTLARSRSFRCFPLHDVAPHVTSFSGPSPRAPVRTLQ